MNSSKNEIEEMAQQRLCMAEPSIAGQAEEAYKRRAGDFTQQQQQQAEARDMSKLRAELRSAQVLNGEMQVEGVQKLSLFEAKVDEMSNLTNELRATNERQRIRYESQLYRQRSLLAAHQPPIHTIPVSDGISLANKHGKSTDERNISSEELIPEAPGLPKPEEQKGRSRERVAKSIHADKEKENPSGRDQLPSPPDSSSSSSEASDGLCKKKIEKMIKKQLNKVRGKSDSSARTKGS